MEAFLMLQSYSFIYERQYLFENVICNLWQTHFAVYGVSVGSPERQLRQAKLEMSASLCSIQMLYVEWK